MKKTYRTLLCSIIFFGLILRFIITIQDGMKNHEVLQAIGNFFSYFTIQSNILLGILYVLITIKTFKNQPLKYPVIRGAIMLYITITGLIYAILLAPINPQTGSHLVYVIILHYITPPLALFDWLIWEERKIYQWRYPFVWLIYPLLYFIFILIRGIFAHNYPYPFININQFGYLHVLLNALGMTLLFLVMGSAYTLLNKRLK